MAPTACSSAAAIPAIVYQDGNYEAQRRVNTLKEILKGVGMDEEWVWLRWIAVSEVEILERG